MKTDYDKNMITTCIVITSIKPLLQLFQEFKNGVTVTINFELLPLVILFVVIATGWKWLRLLSAVCILLVLICLTVLALILSGRLLPSESVLWTWATTLPLFTCFARAWTAFLALKLDRQAKEISI